jgi:hypothetical protein
LVTHFAASSSRRDQTLGRPGAEFTVDLAPANILLNATHTAFERLKLQRDENRPVFPATAGNDFEILLRRGFFYQR